MGAGPARRTIAERGGQPGEQIGLLHGDNIGAADEPDREQGAGIVEAWSSLPRQN
jgi:hypothetical protein